VKGRCISQAYQFHLDRLEVVIDLLIPRTNPNQSRFLG
ncbi:unnamed protein product, partial [Acidithrix sp. C25]